MFKVHTLFFQGHATDILHVGIKADTDLRTALLQRDLHLVTLLLEIGADPNVEGTEVF
jgi:hypothetical protein